MRGSERKTVLLLGAGASKASDFNLPTMVNFFETDLNEKYPKLAQFLEWFYPGRDCREYNLEEVLAYLELSRVRQQLWGYDSTPAPGSNSELLFEELLKYVRVRLQIPSKSACQLHVELFQRLSSFDSVLTVNYDLIADQSLLTLEPKDRYGSPDETSRIGKLYGLLQQLPLFGGGMLPPTLMPDEREKGFYLKLHGSLDWLYCPHSGCFNNMNVFPLTTAPEHLVGGQAEGEPCRFCGASLQILLIPPVATKRLEDRGRLAFLWNLAFREIRSASRFVVIGLSLAPTDFELRWLIRQAIEGRDGTPLEVHIVNPEEKDRLNIVGALPGRGHIVYEYESIRDYLASASKHWRIEPPKASLD